jgi:hypothetical protein
VRSPLYGNVVTVRSDGQKIEAGPLLAFTMQINHLARYLIQEKNSEFKVYFALVHFSATPSGSGCLFFYRFSPAGWGENL